MKRTGARLAAVALALTSFALAQDQKDSTKNDAAAAAPATPAAKHLPQAKTDAEFSAYSAAMASTTPEAAEKAADDFAAKYPASEIKILVYKQAMQLYQNANNIDKVIDMGHKCLAIDPEDPQVLANTAQALTDRPNSTDADKEEAQKDAEMALQTVDTDLIVNPGTPQEKVNEYKGFLRSTAFGSLGIIYYTKDTKEGYAKAEEYLRKSIDAVPSQDGRRHLLILPGLARHKAPPPRAGGRRLTTPRRRNRVARRT